MPPPPVTHSPLYFPLLLCSSCSYFGAAMRPCQLHRILTAAACWTPTLKGPPASLAYVMTSGWTRQHGLNFFSYLVLTWSPLSDDCPHPYYNRLTGKLHMKFFFFFFLIILSVYTLSFEVIREVQQNFLFVHVLSSFIYIIGKMAIKG